MANIIPLKESSGAQFYPQTHEKAVVDSNGVTLASKLANISAPSYVVAWDGNSTPVVANIPAGVTFTFGGQTYTGTLAASSSTVNKTYLVYDNNGNFDEYITQLSGSTYSWVHLGNTSIDLSDYATKEELNQLDQKTAKKADSEEDGAFLTDDHFRVAAKYTAQGFDVAKLSAHFISLLQDAGIGSQNIVETEEDGFFVVDMQSYIGFAVESTGVKPSALKFDFIN